MLRLLSLILFLSSLNVLADGTVSTRLSEDTLIELANAKSSTQTQAFYLVTPKILKFWTLSLSLQNKKQDFSDKTVTGKTGQIIPLASVDDGVRNILSSAVEYQQGSILSSLFITQDTKPSVFSLKSYGLIIRKDFFSSATQASFSLDKSLQSQPDNYFINPISLQSQKRLERIETQKVSLGLEQILTENLRSRIQYSESKTNSYRPLQRSLKLANALALSSRWTSRFDMGYAYEDHSENLFDDRGYFQSQWLESQISYEWALDSFIGLGWSTVLENENDSRRSYSAHLGTDTFGLYLNKTFKDLTAGVKIAQTQTSESQSGFSAQGDLKWSY